MFFFFKLLCKICIQITTLKCRQVAPSAFQFFKIGFQLNNFDFDLEKLNSFTFVKMMNNFYLCSFVIFLVIFFPCKSAKKFATQEGALYLWDCATNQTSISLK